MTDIKRGEIYLVSLDPTMGHEIAKTRPVLIISNDIGNKYSGTITIIPITSQKLERIYPFEVKIEKGTAHLPKDSKVKADQIRTIDKRRIVKRIGVLDNNLIIQVETALKIHLNL